jgi:hypothetical protein
LDTLGQTAVTASVEASVTSVNLFPPGGGGPGSATTFPLPNGWLGRTVFNDSTAVLYLKYGTTASETDYTVQLAPGGYYEFPQPLYIGPVDGIWASANGNARLTAW